jgi:hypothetical protein
MPAAGESFTPDWAAGTRIPPAAVWYGAKGKRSGERHEDRNPGRARLVQP